MAGEHELLGADEDQRQGVAMSNGGGEKLQRFPRHEGMEHPREEDQREDGNDPRSAADDAGEGVAADNAFQRSAATYFA